MKENALQKFDDATDNHPNINIHILPTALPVFPNIPDGRVS